MIQGGAVLLLLSMFFAYLLAPAVAEMSSRVRVGRRGRPLSRPAAIILIYLILFIPGALAWRASSDRVEQWVRVTAPAAVDRLFGGGDLEAIDHLIAEAPVPPAARPVLKRGADGAIAYILRQARTTLDTLIDAAAYARWLVVAAVLAFLLLTLVPRFWQSTLRVLPRGHLQWRGGEYLQDVNSALAGYVRAQAAAGVIVGIACVGGFAMLGVPSAVSMGVAAGILELVPVIGPLVALLIAITQAAGGVLPVVVFLGVLRIVQDYVIYPRLVGRGMHLSTPAVILTSWAGAAMAGAGGVIIAVPVAGLLSVSARHWREYRDIERLVRTSARDAATQQPDRPGHEAPEEGGREE
ncbi:MAG: AI-2E family transporter [Acidobacteria bacterium]|nr:AI-2E family transporter [Acidobacteriota bacterium]